jgi:hypothetical protein
VIANNITAKARLGVWMVSRSVKGLQSITDGCMYTPDRVYSKTENSIKPGLQTLSDYRLMEKHTSIKTTSLGGFNWFDLFAKKKSYEEYPSIDNLVNNHVKSFWRNYNIEFPYDIEHKNTHMSTKSFYIKKAYYMYKDFTTDEVCYKIRGLRSSQIEGSVYKRIGDILLKGEETSIASLQQTYTYTTRVSDYISSKKKDKIIYPGVKVSSVLNFLLSNLDLPYINNKDYKKRKKNPTNYEHLFLNKNSIEGIEKIYNLRIQNHIAFMKKNYKYK